MFQLLMIVLSIGSILGISMDHGECYICGLKFSGRKEFRETHGRKVHISVDICKSGVDILHRKIKKLNSILTYKSFQMVE